MSEYIRTNNVSDEALDIVTSNIESNSLIPEDPTRNDIIQHIRQQWHVFRNHRTTLDYADLLTDAQRGYMGEYTDTKLHAISQQGGSNVFARITTIKCRAASAVLSDLYLGGEQPWTIQPTPVPAVPVEIKEDIGKLIQAEAGTSEIMGEPVTPDRVQMRAEELMSAAIIAAKEQAHEAAAEAQAAMEDILVEGGYYKAMQQFLVDLPVFPLAIIKGPYVEMERQVEWVLPKPGSNKAPKTKLKTKPMVKWRRVSPFDVFFDPAATSLAESDIIERRFLKRVDLVKMRGTPGADDNAINAALEDYQHGHFEYWDDTDSDRDDNEGHEHRPTNEAKRIMCLEYHGHLRGEWLLDYKIPDSFVSDPNEEYMVSAWVVGEHLIKLVVDGAIGTRHPYYGESFEPMPDRVYGTSLVQLLADVQDVANACMRSLVNNMSISSGPMYYVNEERLSSTTDPDNVHPWKRWRFLSDPSGDMSKPIEFFQPASNAGELLNVYQAMTQQADEVSAIPRYVTGSGSMAGAAGTASGLAMLMGNTSKILQNVARQIDRNVVTPNIERLYRLLLLTDSGVALRGDEKVVVSGVSVAMSREQDRMRQLEFLQMTNNPVDMQLMGVEGRASLLRELSKNIGMDHTKVIPDSETIKQRQQAQQQQAQQQAVMQGAAQAQGGQAPTPRSQGEKGSVSEGMQQMSQVSR